MGQRRRRVRVYMVGRGRFRIPLNWFLIYLATLLLIGLLVEFAR